MGAILAITPPRPIACLVPRSVRLAVALDPLSPLPLGLATPQRPAPESHVDDQHKYGHHRQQAALHRASVPSAPAQAAPAPMVSVVGRDPMVDL